MDELTPQILNHLSLFSFTDAYWMLNQNARSSFHEHWLQGLTSASTNVDIYQNLDSRADLLVWCALIAPEPASAAEFFSRFAFTATPYRHLIRPIDSIWGFTDPAPDAKARSPLEIDPLSSTRLRYPMVYPIGSGPDWYQMSPASRREVIQKYAGLGNRYEDVKQLVLHSFGLQPQDFVLLYETDDLSRFNELASQMRNDDAGSYEPAGRTGYTAVYHPAAETLQLWK